MRYHQNFDFLIYGIPEVKEGVVCERKIYACMHVCHVFQCLPFQTIIGFLYVHLEHTSKSSTFSIITPNQFISQKDMVLNMLTWNKGCLAHINNTLQKFTQPLAMIFDIILYKVVQQEMGLNSFTIQAEACLGIMVTKVLFTALYILHLTNKF